MPTKAKEVRPHKVEAVKEIKEKFERAKIAIFTEYQVEKEEGLLVKEVQQLRRKMLASKGEFKVVKNTLARKALAELKIKDLDKYFERASAVAFGYDDAAAAAKALFEFAKDSKKERKQALPVVKAAWYEKGILDLNQVKFLASLPPKNVLLSQLLGTMNAPVRGLATVLAGTLRSVVTVLDALKRKKEAEVPAPVAKSESKTEEKPVEAPAKAEEPPAETPKAEAAPPAEEPKPEPGDVKDQS